MNYREENVRLGLRLLKKLRNKYGSDKFDKVFAEKVITKVCFSISFPKDQMKNYIYFNELSEYVDLKINAGVHSSEIFNAIGTVANDIKRKINNTEITMRDIEEKKKERFEEATKYSINKRLDLLKDKSREELELMERYQVVDSMDKYGHFRDKLARGKIIGSLNRGFYSMNLDELANYIRTYGGKCNKRKRFVNIMPDELLKYRIVLMELLRVYNERGKDRKLSLDEMREKVEFLGEIGRDMFAKEYLNVPEDVLVNMSLRKKVLDNQIEIDLEKVRK